MSSSDVEIAKTRQRKAARETSAAPQKRKWKGHYKVVGEKIRRMPFKTEAEAGPVRWAKRRLDLHHRQAMLRTRRSVGEDNLGIDVAELLSRTMKR